MVSKPQHSLITLLSTGIFERAPDTLDLNAIDWSSLEKTALENNVFPLLSHSIDELDIEAPDDLKASMATMRAQCFAQGMSHIAAAVRLTRMFQTHGIDVICVKGTARAFEVYGKWDARFTHDIDLLVRTRDYREAAKVLLASGYSAPISEDDVWWHEYLGESPYLPVETDGPTVDLHHKLHQPGTPAISNLDALHDNRVLRDFGSLSLPMLDKRDALMLTATSFGKAIRARQPWLGYAHEIAYARANDTELNDDLLTEYAKHCGMSRLWDHAKTVSDAVFLQGADSWQQDTREPAARSIHAARPAAETASGEPRLKPEPQVLYRSRLLWRWSEGWIMRPFNFLREFFWVNLSEIRHDMFANKQRSE